MGVRTRLNKQITRQLLLGVLSIHVNLLVSSAGTSTDTGPVFHPTLPLPQLVPRQDVDLGQPCLDPHCGITLAPSRKHPSGLNTLESPIASGDIQDMEYIYRGHIGRVTKNLDNISPPATPSYRIVQVQPMEHIVSKRAAKFRHHGSSLTKVSTPSNLVYTHTTRKKEVATNKLNRSVKLGRGQWKEDGHEMTHWSQNSLVSFGELCHCSLVLF